MEVEDANYVDGGGRGKRRARCHGAGGEAEDAPAIRLAAGGGDGEQE